MDVNQVINIHGSGERVINWWHFSFCTKEAKLDDMGKVIKEFQCFTYTSEDDNWA
jgi:hypothetical protein